jgi:GMP synthase (glutamine-hydrolysing)
LKYFYILKTGTTFPSILNRFGDFDRWTISAFNPGTVPVRVVDVENGESLPPASNCRGVIITGSHSMVTDNLPWSLAIEQWLPSLIREQIPLLAICYGHQLLARAMGGDVGYNTGGIETGTVDVGLSSASSEDRLFSSLPLSFSAHVDHSQSVIKLPPGAVCLASSAHEKYLAYRYKSCAWGLQFHPEFTAEIMSSYISEQAEKLRMEGLSLPGLLAGVRETPISWGIVHRFYQIASRTSHGE